MSVPNTTSFSLQNVVNEIAGSQNDLIECFTEGNSSGFDSSYSGSKNSLLNFRNYDDSAGGGGTPSSTTYYQLSGCTSGTAYTSIAPSGTGQRYILPSATPTYYTYNGTTISQTTAPVGFNSNIQRVTGQLGCP